MNGQLDGVFKGNVDEWVAELPQYQRTLIESLLVERDPVDVATAWLSTSGPRETAPLGAVARGASLFYDKVLEELHALLCDPSRYEAERRTLRARGAQGLSVAAISTTLEPHVGAAAVFIGSVIALSLGVVGRASVGAGCEALSELIDRRKAVGGDGPSASAPAP